MKSKILVLTGLLLLFSSNLFSEQEGIKNEPSPQGKISVYSTPELYDLASRWASEYGSLNPELKINVINVNEGNMAGLVEAGANFGFTSGDQILASGGKQFWKMAVARDVIVPIISSNNPFLGELFQKGISSEKFTRFFYSPENRVWGTFLVNGQNVPVHLYILNDESVTAAVKKFLNIDQIPVDGINSVSEEEMITAIQNDPYAVGFCKMVNIIGPDKQSMIENIKLLPIDKNGNGKIDYMEKIYNDLDVFARGVWIGKYPKALSTDVYFVSKAQPANELEIAFLKWIIQDGQQFLYGSGFSDLVYNERQSKVDKFNGINLVPPSKEIYSFQALTLIILSVIVILSIIISAIVFIRRKQKGSIPSASINAPHIFNEDSVIVPGGLYFDKTHTWVFMETDGVVKIGIDDFLQHITGPVTRIEMKNPGEKIKKGDLFLSIIQKGKQLNIYAPISGTILEQNKVLIANSSVINSSPYSDGWVYMIEPANWSREIQFLDMAEKYRKWLLDEFSRVKDFLAGSLKVNRIEYEHVVFQDGGILKEGILEDLGPEVWEDFQTNFLDTYK